MSDQPSTSRLEAFSDGVIAVIITIMVLEIKVPREDGWAGFRSLIPIFLVYLLSFLFTGIYWINHHHVVDRIEKVDAAILWANLGFLFCLSLLPFFTGYLIEKKLDRFSAACYALSLFSSGVAFNLLKQATVRHLERSGAKVKLRSLELDRAEQRKGYLTVTLYFAAALLAYWKPYATLALVASVTLLWIIPTFGLHKHNVPAESNGGTL